MAITLPFNGATAGLPTQSVSDSGQSIPDVIEQTERLFTTRSRSIQYQTGDGDRGQRTFIKVISGDANKSMERHLSEDHSEPTSIGDASSGPLSDAINDTSVYGGYADFLLTGIRGGFTEKMQIIETFGDSEIVYYFGRHPVMMEFSGVLVDSPDNNWFVQFIEMYSHVMRGTQLARNYELLKIVTPNMTIIGSITTMSWTQDSGRDVDIPFQFSFLAKQIIPTPVINAGVPMGNPDDLNTDKVAAFRSQSEIVSYKDSINALEDTVKDPFSTTQDYANALQLKYPLQSGRDPQPTLVDGPRNESNANGTGTRGVDMFANVSSNLSGIRASLFSPVYGVLSSLTKLIKKTTGSVASVINSFTTPVRNVLRDVRNISNQAAGIVTLVNNSIRQIGAIPKAVDSELRATLMSLKKTSGVIGSAPQTITSNLRDLVNSGKLPATSLFLQNKPGTTLSAGTHPITKIMLLNSGKPHTAQSGATI